MPEIGGSHALEFHVRNDGGNLANAATVTLTITLPDQSTLTPAVANPPDQTGVYVANFVPSTIGRHSVRWQATAPARVFSDVLDVSPPSEGLLSLAIAKKTLNMSANRSDQDDELRLYIDATTLIVEAITGPIIRRTCAEIVTTRGCEVALSSYPILSVTSAVGVQPGTPGIDVADLDIDSEAGIVRRISGTPFPYAPVKWIYTAGRSVVRSNIQLAAGVIVKHLWETQRGTQGRPNIQGGPTEDVGAVNDMRLMMAGYVLPRRAQQLLEPDMHEAGFA